MLAWTSGKANTWLGLSDSICSIIAVAKATIISFFFRKTFGRTTHAVTPTIRSCWPSKQSVYTFSSLRQIILSDEKVSTLLCLIIRDCHQIQTRTLICQISACRNAKPFELTLGHPLHQDNQFYWSGSNDQDTFAQIAKWFKHPPEDNTFTT